MYLLNNYAIIHNSPYSIVIYLTRTEIVFILKRIVMPGGIIKKIE